MKLLLKCHVSRNVCIWWIPHLKRGHTTNRWILNMSSWSRKTLLPLSHQLPNQKKGASNPFCYLVNVWGPYLKWDLRLCLNTSVGDRAVKCLLSLWDFYTCIDQAREEVPIEEDRNPRKVKEEWSTCICQRWTLSLILARADHCGQGSCHRDLLCNFWHS